MVGVLMIGAGEYTCGFVKGAHGAAADKPAGVVALTCFDLRRLGVVSRLVLCDHTGRNFPAVRATLQSKIGDVYKGMNVSVETVPEDDVERDDKAYLKAIQRMHAGDVVTVFTPDDTHFDITMAAVKAGLHVLVAKPVVKTLQQHLQLAAAAEEHGVLVAVEYHKRWDPMYGDARARIRSAAMGPFSHFSSLMAQPKQQLATFSRWAGLSSDISYYLNSHHIDFHHWAVGHMARPVRVVASAASGAAEKLLGRPCEDTITLLVTWRGLTDGSTGTAVYTASWIAPKGECHTQQEFLYMGQGGLLRVDQAHRGYCASSDQAGYSALNPLYMRYVPDEEGNFQGQSGYGYLSIAAFIEAAAAVGARTRSVQQYQREGQLALVGDVLPVTAVLEGGRVSADHGGRAVRICYDEGGMPMRVEVEG